MTNSIFFKVSYKKNESCLRHSVVSGASAQRIKIPVRPTHPGGRCYNIFTSLRLSIFYFNCCVVILVATIILMLPTAARAQSAKPDSLRLALTMTTNDTLKVVILTRLIEYYSETSPDSSFVYSNELARVANRLSYKLDEANAQLMIGYALLNKGNYPRSLRAILAGLAIAENPESDEIKLPRKYYRQMTLFGTPFNIETQRLSTVMMACHFLGILYSNAEDYNKAFDFLSRALATAMETKNDGYLALVYSAMGRIHRSKNNNDSALHYLVKAYRLTAKEDYQGPRATIILNLAQCYLARGDSAQAIHYIRDAIVVSSSEEYFRGVIAGELLLSDVYRRRNLLDSSLYFGREGLALSKQMNAPDLLQRSYAALASHYRTTHNSDSTIKYIDLVSEMNARNFNAKQAQEFQNIEFDETLRQREIMETEAAFQNRLQKYALITGLLIVAIVAIFLWRINRQRQKSNTVLQQQKKAIEEAMANLKAAQSQLIQSEKMASLGELTAGIAHEIQNPLNFVNNFSEVNKELLTEMDEGIKKGNFAEVKSIVKDIISNEEKISHHGKRADAIVKGMLQHSRSSSGVKEPTDINALCDEYLRLSYHGFRAKDNSFNTSLNTDYDKSIGTLNIIPQDIGRVILNLINNAFYAVKEKGAQLKDGYVPTISVSTKKSADNVLISVKDNGNGIPQNILDKIYQPFFTTRPTGQGTGLGLSLSYDIVKAHGGTMKVKTQENEGAEFQVELPIASQPKNNVES
jgi:two-component system NtrC family sensor kinase